MWFKVDDKLHDHHKTRKAGKAAMGVWVLAGSWSADRVNDGFVPADILPRWGTRADAKKLVDAGLWEVAEQDDEKGWRFRDWAEYQPTSTDVRLRKEKESESGARGNHIKWHVKRGVENPDCPLCVGGTT